MRIKFSKSYRVEFLTKKGGLQFWRIDLDALDEKMAKEKAKQMWDGKLHMFDIEAHPLKNGEEFLYHWFKKIPKEESGHSYAAWKEMKI